MTPSTPSLSQVLLVGSGGFVGSALRFLVSGWVYRSIPLAGFPWGTLAVNLAGCLAIGALGGLAQARQVLGPQTRLFLMIGMLGGFTTFSTFSYESVTLLAQREELRALAYVSLHLLLGIGFAWLGYRLTSIT